MIAEREIAIVGAGPAGMAAAVEAAAHGVAVLLVDENQRIGGKVFQDSGLVPQHLFSNPGEKETAQRLFCAFERERKKIELFLGTTVWGITEEKIVGLQHSAAANERASRLKAKKILVCPGALERVVPFPNWTLPGVFTIGGLSLLVKNGVLPGKKFLIAGSGPLLLVLTANLIRAGGEIAAVAFAGSLRKSGLKATAFFSGPGLRKLKEGLGYLKTVRANRTPIHRWHIIKRAIGDVQVEGAVITSVDSQWRPVSGTEKVIEADAIVCSYGLIPSNELLRLCGCRQQYDSRSGYWSTWRNQSMETSVRGVFVAGDGGYVKGYEAAIIEGRIAALEACAQLGRIEEKRANELKHSLRRTLLPHGRIGKALDAFSFPGPGIFDVLTADTVICRCEEVTTGEIKKACQYGAVDINDLKRRTRCGMGHCQGRFCGQGANELLRRFGIPEEKTLFTTRLPVKPVTFGTLAKS